MANIALLEAKIDEKGLKRNFIAKKIKISQNQLIKKMNNVTQFKANEIGTISRILGLSDKETRLIFFADDSDNNSQNSEQ